MAASMAKNHVSCLHGWSMQVPENDAQMLERCAVLRGDTFSVGQMDICHRFSIQIEYQCISKENLPRSVHKESARECAQGIC